MLMNLTLLFLSFRRWIVFEVFSRNVVSSLRTPVLSIDWLEHSLVFDYSHACPVYECGIGWWDWSSLNQELRHVQRLFNWFVNWLSDWCWRNCFNGRMSDLLDQSSRSFQRNANLLELWSQVWIVQKLMVQRVIGSEVFIEPANGLNLVDDELRRISDSKVFPGKDFLPVLFDPGKQEILRDSMLPINFN